MRERWNTCVSLRVFWATCGGNGYTVFVLTNSQVVVSMCDRYTLDRNIDQSVTSTTSRSWPRARPHRTRGTLVRPPEPEPSKDNGELLIVDTSGLPNSREISEFTFICLPGFGHSRLFLARFIMLKRPATTQKATRKRRKGGTTYSVTKLDLQDNKTVENIRVWDVSTSGRTGRVSASRRTVEHCHQDLSEPEGPATSNQPEVVEEINVEEAGTLADPDAPADAEESREKKPTKANKDNDSVSEIIY